MPVAKTAEAEIERRRKISYAQRGVSKGPGKPWSDERRVNHSNVVRRRWAHMTPERRAEVGARIGGALTRCPPVADVTQKGCTVCKRTFPRSAFTKDSRALGGLGGVCKECACARAQKWALDHPDRVVSFRRARYKIDFNALWEQQGGNCALCSEPMLPRGKKALSAVIDHDHTCCSGSLGKSCGKCVRGLLHQRCNLFLGHIENRFDLVQRAVKYLDRGQGGAK